MKKKDENIQIMRACMTLMVIFSHLMGCLLQTQLVQNLYLSPLRVLWGGSAAVAGFYVLCGYFSAYSYMRHPVRSVREFVSYIIHRFIRLFPMADISLIICLIGCNYGPKVNHEVLSGWINEFWPDKYKISDFWRQMLLFRADNSLNPPIWTIAVEVQVVIPLFIIMSFLFFYYYKYESRFKYIDILFFFLIFISDVIRNGIFFVFVAGVVVFHYHSRIKKIISNYSKALFFIGITLMYLSYLFTENAGSYTIFSLAWICILFAVAERKIHRNLFIKILIKIGDYSYGIFLIHFPILLLFRNIVSEYSVYKISLYFIFTFGLSMISGYLLTILVNMLIEKTEKIVTYIFKHTYCELKKG